MEKILTDTMIREFLDMPMNYALEISARNAYIAELYEEFGMKNVLEAIAIERALTVKQLKNILSMYRDDLKVLVMTDSSGYVFAPLVVPIGEYIRPSLNIVLRIGDKFAPERGGE